MMLLAIVALLLVVLTARLDRREPTAAASRLERWLDSRAMLVPVFLVTVAVLLYVWGGTLRRPIVHDELAYVLQAEIFARGRWTLPSPAFPLFFEQPYVLVEPALASKYFPGHSLLLALGALAGWMPLVPLVLQGTAACLIVVLARRVANGAVALFTWAFWLMTPMVLHFGPAYYSESTTVVCWLAGWYALLEWRTSRRLRWLLAVAVCTGWCVLTRPLTGLAYAIPIGVVVIADAVRGRLWRDFSLALLAGALVLAIIPLWSAKTTGDWRTTPLQRYTRDYMPYDLPGFGLIADAPARTLNPQFEHLNQVFRQYHPGHQPAAVPGLLASRARYLGEYVWGWSRGLLAAFALVGLVVVRGPALFAVGSSVLLLLVYLSFGTPASWSLYYYESVPAYAFLTAAGVAWMAAAIGARRLPRADDPDGWRSRRWTRPLVAGTLALGLPHLLTLRTVRIQHAIPIHNMVTFARLRASIPAARAVLFVRYAPWHTPHETFVQNSADPERERVLVVHDRGEAENARLLASMPDRTGFLLDEGSGRSFRYHPAPAAGPAPAPGAARAEPR